jgi:hypothetical protein
VTLCHSLRQPPCDARFPARSHSREVAERGVVAGRAPLALLDHLLDGAANLGARLDDVVGGELVEGTRLLDVLQRRLEVGQLRLDLRGGGLGLLGL